MRGIFHKDNNLHAAFVITEDKIDDGRNEIPRKGPVYYTAIVRGKAFKIYDDDGEHYYSGYLLDMEDEFAPLDWAQWNAGATEIQYWNEKTRKWEVL